MSSFKEVVNRQYSIDELPLKDNSTYEEDYLEVLSDQNPPNYSSQIRCELKDVNNFTNLSKGYLELRVRVETNAGADLGAADNVAIVNNIASIFSRSVCRINNVVVETNELAHNSNHLKSLLEFSSDYAASVGSNMGVSPDTDAHTATAAALLPVDQATGAYNEAHNKGFYDRRKLATENVATNQTYHLPLTHLFGCCLNKVMMNNQFSIELTRQSDVVCLYGADAANKRIKIDRCSLWLPRITPSPLVQAQLLGAISSGVVSPYMFHTWSAYDSNIVGSQSSITQRVITQSERPVWVFTFATLATVAQTASPYHTPANSLDRVQCRINGKLMPSVEFTSLTSSLGQSRTYNELVKYAASYMNSRDGILINKDDYKHNLVVGFDCRALPENLARSGNTIEVIATVGNTGADMRLHTCVVSQKAFDMTYGGGVPTITML